MLDSEWIVFLTATRDTFLRTRNPRSDWHHDLSGYCWERSFARFPDTRSLIPDPFWLVTAERGLL
jgi:hypothetical protein